MLASESLPDAFCCVDDLLIERAGSDDGNPIIGYPRFETSCSDFLLLTARDIHQCTDAAVWKLLDLGLRRVVGSTGPETDSEFILTRRYAADS